MSSAPDRPTPPVNPRPGVVKALGICNVVFSAISVFYLLATMAWMMAVASGRAAAVKFEVGVSAQPGQRPTTAFNPMMGMDSPTLMTFNLVNSATGLITNGIMFATGIGLMNLRRWGARWWAALAWVKIAMLIVIWGAFIVVVAPALSESMARNATRMMSLQPVPRRGAPTVEYLTRIYSIMCLVGAVGMIGFGSIYPAISIWLLGRPGVKAALVGKPRMEPELP